LSRPSTGLSHATLDTGIEWHLRVDRARDMTTGARACVFVVPLSGRFSNLRPNHLVDFADEAGAVVRALTPTPGRALGGALACPGQGAFAEVVVGHFVRTRRLQVGLKGAQTSSNGSPARQRTPPRCSRACRRARRKGQKVRFGPPAGSRQPSEGSPEPANASIPTIRRWGRARERCAPNLPTMVDPAKTLVREPSGPSSAPERLFAQPSYRSGAPRRQPPPTIVGLPRARRRPRPTFGGLSGALPHPAALGPRRRRSVTPPRVPAALSVRHR
jgi:hypothetical protein